MKIIVRDNIKEFSSNKILLSRYSKRQLEAIYEMLSDRRLGKIVTRMLDEQDLINVKVYEKQLEGVFWSKYKQRYILVGVKDETTTISTVYSQ